MKVPVMAAAVLLAAAACSADTVSDPSLDTVSLFPRSPGQSNATVRFLNLEGGCWVLDSGGRNYEPTNLPAAYRVDGLRVNVRFHDAPNAGSYCQVGPVVIIESISRS